MEFNLSSHLLNDFNLINCSLNNSIEDKINCDTNEETNDDILTIFKSRI